MNKLIIGAVSVGVVCIGVGVYQSVKKANLKMKETFKKSEEA